MRSARLPSAVRLDGDDVWWSECRPEEGGRTAVLRLGADGAVDRGAAAPVERPLGGPRVRRRRVVGARRRALVRRLGHAAHPPARVRRRPRALDPSRSRPSPTVPRGLRYADGDVSARTAPRCSACGRSTAPTARSSTRSCGSTPADRPSRRSSSAGPDFVCDPRWRPDGDAFCWLEWDHPDMPWDAARLVVDDGGARTVVAGGEQRESICQPTWAADGSLWFSSDRTGLLEPATGGRPPAGSSSSSTCSADIGFPQWVFGERCFALLDERPGGRSSTVDDGLDHLRARGRRLGHAALDLGHLDGVFARTPAETRGARGRVAGDRAARRRLPTAGRRDRARRRWSGRPTARPRPRAAWWSVPEASTSRPPGGATAHALWYPPTNPRRRRSGGRAPAAARAHPRRADGRGSADAPAEHPVLDEPGLRRGRRELPRLDRLRPGLPRPAAGPVGDRRRRGLRRRGRAPGRRGAASTPPAAHPGGSAGGFTTLAALAFHDVFAAGASHYGVADLGLLAAGHPQVRGPLPRRARRSVARGQGHLRRALADPPPRGHRPPARRVPGRSRTRSSRPTRPSSSSTGCAAAACRWPTCVRGRGPRLPQGREHPSRRSTASCRFYAQVLGFDLPDGRGHRPDRGPRTSSRPGRGRAGGGSAGSGPISNAPSSASSARGSAGGVVDVELEQRLALGDHVSPTVACHTTPAPGDTGSSLRARPAPRRQAATPTAIASSRWTRRRSAR